MLPLKIREDLEVMVWRGSLHSPKSRAGISPSDSLVSSLGHKLSGELNPSVEMQLVYSTAQQIGLCQNGWQGEKVPRSRKNPSSKRKLQVLKNIRADTIKETEIKREKSENNISEIQGNYLIGWLVGWLFCFMAHQLFQNHLTPN